MASSMSTRKMSITIVLAIAFALVVVGSLAAYVATYNISNTVKVKTVAVGVFWDSSCSNPVSAIDWGTLELGAIASKVVYIRNEGVTTITLNMTTSNWIPSLAASYIELSWNRENYVLSSDSIVETVFTMSVAQQITAFSDFSFDITITGEGYS